MINNEKENPETGNGFGIFFVFLPVVIKTSSMKNKIIIFLLSVCQIVTATDQKKNPKWMEIAYKAIITVETTTKEGITKNGTGFLINENGEAIASYELFRKAEKAVVITSNGDKLPVTHILGADDMHNVIRFKVTVPKKTFFLPVSKISPMINSTAYIPTSKEMKELAQGAISEITKMNSSYDYYKIEMPLSPSQVDFPLFTETGEVFALSQSDASGKGKTYGISIAYIQSLQITVTDLFKKTYTEIGVRKAWSSSIEDAQMSLMLYASQQDAQTYLETLNDFIDAFPNYADGYIKRASHYTFLRKELASSKNEQLQFLDKALNDLEYANKFIKNKGDEFYNKAKLIFEAITDDSTLIYKNWNLKTVEENIQKAIKQVNNPAYRQLEGDIAFFQSDFEKSYNCYSIVNNSSESNGYSYYFAAKSKQQIKDADIFEIITLLDSAVAKSAAFDASAYLLEIIDLKLQYELYDQLVKDYDKYLELTDGNVSDAFYYYREQAKFRINDLEGALKDINMAILIDNSNALYFAEQASVYLRINEAANAQKSIEQAIKLDPEFSSAHRILGVCLVRQEKKSEACKHFIRAKELGDPVAERLINDNCKE